LGLQNLQSCIQKLEDQVESGNNLTGSAEIKEGPKAFFSNLYTNYLISRPNLGNEGFMKLDENQVTWLEREVTIKEVHYAIFSSDGSKAPGLDGFNFKLYMQFWEFVKHDLFTVILEFFRRGKLLKGINTSYIALNLKIAGISPFNDFRPVNLLNKLYKIIAKILAITLKEVMQSVVSPSQSAFIAGKNILDPVLFADEMLDSMKSRGCQGFLLKLDFRKAFDTVSWSYLDKFMGYMNFGA
jgi:hypothetical protein